MFKDGKYKLRKDGQEYEAVITTLSVYDGFYSKTSDVQFVCIPGHFPIPLDSWLLEDFVMLPIEAVEQSVQRTVLCTCETIDTQVTKLLNCECPVHGSHSG